MKPDKEQRDLCDRKSASCRNHHHRALARLMTAIEELQEAAEEVLELDADPAAHRYDVTAVRCWDGVKADVEGALWAVGHLVCLIESESTECCWGPRRREELQEDMRRARERHRRSAAERVEPDLVIAEQR